MHLLLRNSGLPQDCACPSQSQQICVQGKLGSFKHQIEHDEVVALVFFLSDVDLNDDAHLLFTSTGKWAGRTGGSGDEDCW